MTARIDSVLRCIVGGAIGDVLGGVSERMGMSISDDTQFTLATCEAISNRPTNPVLPCLAVIADPRRRGGGGWEGGRRSVGMWRR